MLDRCEVGGGGGGTLERCSLLGEPGSCEESDWGIPAIEIGPPDVREGAMYAPESDGKSTPLCAGVPEGVKRGGKREGGCAETIRTAPISVDGDRPAGSGGGGGA